MLFVALALLGTLSFRRLPVDLLPDIAYPRLIIHTSYPHVAPAEVERFVSERVEQAAARVPGVREVESVSREGISLVTVRFAWGTDMDFAALSMREALDNLRGTLPELAGRPTVLRTDPRSEPVMALAVSGGTDLWTLKELAETVFRRRLEQIDGVAQVSVTGGLEREIHVEVDPRRLEAHAVTVDEVARALAAANAAAPGGTVRRGRYRLPLRTLGELAAVEEIGDVVVREDSGAVLRVADLARVEDGHRERESIARSDGREAVGLLLFTESGANTVRVARAVEEVLAQLRAAHPEVAIRVAMSQAVFVEEAVDNVVQGLLQGAVLAFLILFLFLRSVRYPVAIALAIPLSVLMTFSLLDLAGVSLNIMTLGGLALGVGMLVDNSIVVLENIFRHRQLVLAPAAAAALGAEEVQSAITSSTLTTIAVFGPILYVEGVAGELLGPLSLAIAFALLASILVALTLLPAMAARWHDGSPPLDSMPSPSPDRLRGALLQPLHAFDRAFQRFVHWYLRVLAAALEHRTRVIGIAAALLLLAIALGASLDRSVLPEVDQGTFRARLELQRGTPLEATAEAATRLESVLLADPDIESVLTHVGRQEAVAGIAVEETGQHTAVIDVRLREGVRTARVLERLAPAFAAFPPGTLTLETGTATALGQLLGGGEADLAARIRGDDLDQAHAYATRLESLLRAAPSLANVRLGSDLAQPEVQLAIDRERAAAFGIEPTTIARTIEAYMQGTRATDLVAFDRRIPVIVRLPDEARHSLETLRILRVQGVPLRELVLSQEAMGPVEIRRRDHARLLPVFADVAGGDLHDAIDDVRATLAAAPPPAGLRVEVGGENEELRRAFRSLAFAFALAVFLVYMILAAEFESLVHPFTILLSVPLAAVGAALSLWIAGAGLNTMSMIGLIVLVGIVDNDAVIKVDFINRLRRQGLSVREAVLAAGRARLRPILMTTVTTLFGVAPMVVGLGAGAELQRPLAVAVFGGLASATALTLIVIPVVYEMVEDARVRLLALRLRRKPAPAPAPATTNAAVGSSP